MIDGCGDREIDYHLSVECASYVPRSPPLTTSEPATSLFAAQSAETGLVRATGVGRGPQDEEECAV